uniref:Alpha-taxilin n=1 Tax=Cuerna arida TaxID=1464854 RepID=A0A1B6EY18_9HEMI
MESSNAGTEVTNVGTDKPTQPIVSPVPDLVTNVPASTASTATPTNVPPATAVNSTSSAVSTEAISAPAKPRPPTTKPTPAVAVKAQLGPTPTTNRATSLPSAASEASVKNRTTREEKIRKKDDKSVDHVLRALNSLNTSEEKLAAMCKKYADIFDEHRKLQLLQKQSEKRCSMLQREKEQLQAEQSKAILTRSRLENLCRELQRQNKAIKDESLLKIREEEEKRKEVSAKFQTTMNEITTLMQQNNDKNMKLRDDNIDMTTKLKNICEQYEIRQQQVERISKQMQLEQQLADAKLSKLKMEMAAEREVLLREKQQLLLELQQYQQRCTEFQATEVNLRNQISMYNDKYDEFQKALARSNDVFGGFKGEMEKMSKKICKLEKETSSWKQRWERSHNALLEMAADKQKSEQELAVVSRQLATLQGLCRTLQTERSNLLAKLKIFQAGGHVPPEKSSATPVEKCTKQCDQVLNHLDQSLNHISENNPVLDSYTKDILASFKESVAAEDTSATTTTDSPVPPETVPVPASPLPDVVGTSSPCVLNQIPDVNSALCQRLEDISLHPSASVLLENTVNKNPQETQLGVVEIENPSVAKSPEDPTKTECTLPVVGDGNTTGDSNIESIVPVTQEISSSEVNEAETLPQVIPVMNGEALTNGSTPTEANSKQETLQDKPSTNPPKSPTAKGSPAKSTDSGKKKESAKKKKK